MATLPTSRTPARLPAVRRAPATPAPKRVEFASLLPQTHAGEYVNKIVEAGWKLDLSTGRLVNKGRTAELEALPLDFRNWLATSKNRRPPSSVLTTLTEEMLNLIQVRVPKTNALL